jgi:mono/diheme cytochrome c family protein
MSHRVRRAIALLGAASFCAAVSLGATGNAQAADPKAERLFRAKCAACHGEDGKGQTEQGKKMGIRDMTDGAWQKEFTDAQMQQTINDGFKRTKAGKAQEMEPFKDKLRPEQLPLVIAYVRSLGK